MGVRGPAPKDPANRQRRNKPAELVLLPNSALAVPDPDPKWLKPTKTEWASLWTAPVAAAIDPRSDVGALMRLFAIKDKVRRYEKTVYGCEVVEGSTGQPTLHPLLKEAHALMGEIRALEDRFGMTPTTRANLGVAIGQSQKTIEEMNKELVSESSDEVEAEDEDPRLRPSS